MILIDTIKTHVSASGRTFNEVTQNAEEVALGHGQEGWQLESIGAGEIRRGDNPRDPNYYGTFPVVFRRTEDS